MKKTLWAGALLGILLMGCAPAQPTLTTFILVRHAEKAADGTKDPSLTAEGLARAGALAQALSDTPIDAIYSTAYKRAQETVLPVATAKGLPVLAYEAMDGGQMDRILAAHKGGTVLVSGHSNTTPWTANYFLGSPTYPDFDDADYDNMLILSIIQKGNAKVMWLTYGVPTK